METKICKCCGRELPIQKFVKTINGYMHTCNDCRAKHIKEHYERKKNEINLKEELTKAKAMRLSQFTPRELMEELARRGYKGKLQYVVVHEINIENF